MASFVYNYGDFRGDPEQSLCDYFDAMLYMANWGTRRLMFRIPGALIDAKRVKLYCISEEIDLRQTPNKQHVIVDWEFNDEEQAEWTEGEGWLDALIALREELIQGNFRVLYLAWLKAAAAAVEMEDITEDMLEPPVPAGLGQLSPALETFVRFLDIDTALLAVAAQHSEQRRPEPPRLEQWITQLPAGEQHDFLVRLSRGAPNLSPPATAWAEGAQLNGRPSSCADVCRNWPRGRSLARQRLRQSAGRLRLCGKTRPSGVNSSKPQSSAELRWPASVTWRPWRRESLRRGRK
jgi:hypothetical protein